MPLPLVSVGFAEDSVGGSTGMMSETIEVGASVNLVIIDTDEVGASVSVSSGDGTGADVVPPVATMGEAVVAAVDAGSVSSTVATAVGAGDTSAAPVSVPGKALVVELPSRSTTVSAVGKGEEGGLVTAGGKSTGGDIVGLSVLVVDIVGLIVLVTAAGS